MDQHTLDKLEFGKLRTLLREKCHTEPGSRLCENLIPTTDYEAIDKALVETGEMAEILRFEEPFVLQTIDPVDMFLSKLKVTQTFLDPGDYLKIAHFIKVCQSLSKYMKGKAEKYKHLWAYVSEITNTPEIVEKIEKAIDKTGEVMDSASSKLRKIRIEKQVVRNRILDKLEAIIQKRRSSETRQDDLITIRDGRYVVPMATSDVTGKTGVIHGRSKTGQTLFVEPMATVEMNNHLRELLNDEEAEIERILIEIGDSIRERLQALQHNYNILGLIDFIHAKGRLAVQLDCKKPILTEKPLINLKKARHPLLLKSAPKAAEVVPLDLSLGEDFDCLVITGPNMGGKTVALKTAGLLALMAQSGLLIPADENSTTGIFEHIFADIGDEQSIELSLSTFSSHISRIIRALEHCSPDSLILMDELGAGTDPVEGSALGEAIIRQILKSRGKAIVTTHYSALKTLAESEARIQNASLEFDLKTLKPTYRLNIGLPGSSYAIEMAKRLGMPQAVIDTAVNLMGSQERSLADLIERLQSETRAAEEARQSISAEKAEVDKLREHYLFRQDQIAEEQIKQREKALKEAEELVEKTRSQLELLVRNIREQKADKDSVRQAQNYVREKQVEFRGKLKNLAPPTAPIEKEALSSGDRVFIENLQTEGELLDYNENSGSWRVQTGSILATVKTELLRKLTGTEKKKKLPAGVNYAPFQDVPMQISVLGMTADEALEAVEKYLDSVSIANLESVFILHGKGTGALRKAIDKYLRTHPLVESHRLGYYNEGGAGVTVVTLKKS